MLVKTLISLSQTRSVLESTRGQFRTSEVAMEATLVRLVGVAAVTTLCFGSFFLKADLIYLITKTSATVATAKANFIRCLSCSDDMERRIRTCVMYVPPSSDFLIVLKSYSYFYQSLHQKLRKSKGHEESDAFEAVAPSDCLPAAIRGKILLRIVGLAKGERNERIVENNFNIFKDNRSYVV